MVLQRRRKRKSETKRRQKEEKKMAQFIIMNTKQISDDSDTCFDNSGCQVSSLTPPTLYSFINVEMECIECAATYVSHTPQNTDNRISGDIWTHVKHRVLCKKTMFSFICHLCQWWCCELHGVMAQKACYFRRKYKTHCQCGACVCAVE